jgi:transposase
LEIFILPELSSPLSSEKVTSEKAFTLTSLPFSSLTVYSGLKWGVSLPSYPGKVDTSLQPNEGLAMPKKTKNKYNHYTEDFRREAVRRTEDPNVSAVDIARELGIHPGQIYNWRRQYKRLSDKQFNSVNGVDYSKQESEEIRKLKREISDLKEENEFLKKATAYFSKENW